MAALDDIVKLFAQQVVSVRNVPVRFDLLEELGPLLFYIHFDGKRIYFFGILLVRDHA